MNLIAKFKKWREARRRKKILLNYLYTTSNKDEWVLSLLQEIAQAQKIKIEDKDNVTQDE